MIVLITGFEPFGKNPINPSEQMLAELPAFLNDEVQLIKSLLPVDQALAPELLLENIHQHQPDAVLAFGLAPGRTKISLERIAVNLKDFRIPDNAGKRILDQPVVEGGPVAYFTTLPVRRILRALLKKNIPAELSLTAGAYLCNQIFYTLMHEINQHHLPIQAGFIHLPALPKQAALSDKPMPSLSLEQDLQATKIIIEELT